MFWQASSTPPSARPSSPDAAKHPVVMKCFELLIKPHIKASLPASLDLLQFAYYPNCSTEDAISTTLHSVITYLDYEDTYSRIMYIDFSPAFNILIPQFSYSAWTPLSRVSWTWTFWLSDHNLSVSEKTPPTPSHRALDILKAVDSVQTVYNTNNTIVHPDTRGTRSSRLRMTPQWWNSYV